MRSASPRRVASTIWPAARSASIETIGIVPSTLNSPNSVVWGALK
jgi:hypothetical protein